MKNTIKQYLRNPFTNAPFGVVVVINDLGKLKFGFSLCSPNDHFDKKLGTEIAINRATSDKLEENQFFAPTVPERRTLIAYSYRILEERARKEFDLPS